MFTGCSGLVATCEAKIFESGICIVEAFGEAAENMKCEVVVVTGLCRRTFDHREEGGSIIAIQGQSHYR